MSQKTERYIDDEMNDTTPQKKIKTSSPTPLPKPPTYLLVILTDVYGCTENYPAVYTEHSKLSDEQRNALYRSIPDTRKELNIPGCDEKHDFGVGYDDEGDDNIIENNIWIHISSDSDIQVFTKNNHCETIIAYYSQ